MTFTITTTGTLATVILNDLGARTFVHPVVAYDLIPEYALEEIRDSADLGSMLDLGHVTALFGVLPVTSSSQLSNIGSGSIVAPHVHDAADITTGTLTLARGGTNANTYTVSQLLRLNAGGTAFESSGLTVGNIAKLNAANAFGFFDQIFQNSTIKILAGFSPTLTYTIQTSTITANRIATIPTLTTNDTFVFQNAAQTLTNKIIDGSLNTITNVSLSNPNVVYNNQANTYGAFDQTFPSFRLKIIDGTTNWRYIFQTNFLTADRVMTLPPLLANDTFVFANHIQTLTNKTMVLGANTFTDGGGTTLGGIIKHNGTKYLNLPLGTANQVLSVVGSDAAWATPQVYSLSVGGVSTVISTMGLSYFGSTSFSNMTDGFTTMSIITPIAGNYLVFFSGLFSNTVVGKTVFIEIYINNVPVGFTNASRRYFTAQQGANNNEEVMLGHTGYRITTAANDTVTIKWALNGGFARANNSTFTLIKTI